MLFLTLNGKSYKITESNIFSSKEEIANLFNISSDDFYLLCNGKLLNDFHNVENQSIYVVPRIFGGKGGFGSMLRAIGAQIEKTTNREACRDLSGRRLRDINEEKRLKNWINQQAEREKQAEDRRQKKLERLCQQPKHEFKDENYDKARSELPEKVEDALEQGLKAFCSSGVKRKSEETKTKKKKTKLWLGSEDELSSSEDSADEENSQNSKENIPESSSNSSNSEDAKQSSEENESRSNDNDIKDEEEPKNEDEKKKE